MSQLRYTRGMLYIRRAKPTDKADSIFTAMSMAAKESMNGPRGYFVVVRRGFPSEVLECGYTRHELKQCFHPGPWKRAQRFFRIAKQEGKGDE